MNFMMAFGWASIMLLVGVFLRAKIAFLKNMLVPASVIAGILGIVFVNIMNGTDVNVYSNCKSFIYCFVYIN